MSMTRKGGSDPHVQPVTSLPEVQSPWVPLEQKATKDRGPKKNAITQASEARLQRFVVAYVATGGNKTEAARQAGVMSNSPRTCASAGATLYRKAIERGLLADKFTEANPEPLNKEDILKLLKDQALGKKPSKRTVVMRRDANGYMREAEVKNEFDEQVAQEKIAKILGLYDDAPKAPVINIMQILGKLPPEQRQIAEAEILDAHGKMLEIGTPQSA